MKQNIKITIIIALVALTIIGLVLLCVFSANNLAEANRLQKVFDSVGDPAILNVAYNMRYVALLYFLWFCFATMVLWWWIDVLLLHPTKRTLTNSIVYGVLTLFSIAICIMFALLQGNESVLRHAYAYMLVAIAITLVIAYITPLIVTKIQTGVVKEEKE